MVESRAFRFIVRSLHLFPGLMLVVALTVLGFHACQFFSQSPDQFISVLSAFNGQ